MTRNARLAGCLILTTLLWAAGAPAAEAAAADWPQWRGPARDGVAPDGPKLLDAWPKEGPKLVWKSEPIPSGKGGCGSVSIAGGRAFVLAHYRRPQAKTVVLNSKDLADFGWIDGLPDDLGKKIDETMKFWRKATSTFDTGRKHALTGPAKDAAIKEFIASLDPKLIEKFGPAIQNRMEMGEEGTVGWDGLLHLIAIRGKEFNAFEELDKQVGGGLSAWHGGPLMNKVRGALLSRFYCDFDDVVCLDAASGKELWRREFTGTKAIQTLDIGPSGTPAIWDGKCYVTSSAGMYCLSVQDGSVIWQTTTTFSNSSPLVANGVVYVFVPELTAFDARSGKVLWTSEAKSVSASVVPWTSGGKSFLLSGNGCIDPATGKVLWNTGVVIDSTPVLAGDDAMVVLGGSETMKFKITPGKAELIWKLKNPGDPRGASPVIYRDHVYVTAACYSGAPVRCFDLNTGEVNWEPKDLFGMSESASPALADGKIIANTNEEDHARCSTIMFKASPEKYEEVGRFKSCAATSTSPAIAGSRLYLRLEDCIACYDLAQREP